MGVPTPQFDADAAAGKALEEYDANNDGLLSVEELGRCTALVERLSLHDADGDGQLSQQELADRIRSWTAEGTGLMSVPCQVTLDGKPLANAKVVFQPMAFLGDANEPADNVSDDFGQCNPTIDPSIFPAELSRMRGVQPGLYQVIVTHETVQIPSSYQEPSILSIEVADDTINPYGYFIKLKSSN